MCSIGFGIKVVVLHYFRDFRLWGFQDNGVGISDVVVFALIVAELS